MSKLSIINARIIDPASGFDDFGAIVTEDGVITEFGVAWKLRVISLTLKAIFARRA